MLLRSDITLEVRRPVFASRISAGFPSPADDFIEGSLDLNKHLVAHPAATFFFKGCWRVDVRRGYSSGRPASC